MNPKQCDTTPENDSPGAESSERYHASEPDDSSNESTEKGQAIITKEPRRCDGKGKYKNNVERLMHLVPESGKADSVSRGERFHEAASEDTIGSLFVSNLFR